MSHLSTWQPCHVDQIMDQTFWKQVLTMRYCRGGNWQWDIVVVGGSGMTAHMWRCLRNSNFRHSFHSQTGTKFCKIYFGIHRWPDVMQNHEGLHNICKEGFILVSVNQGGIYGLYCQRQFPDLWRNLTGEMTKPLVSPHNSHIVGEETSLDNIWKRLQVDQSRLLSSKSSQKYL